ncbi:putative PurR-regulated permease PerM [Litoreibacter meonggei]|uniref:Putative PurR-regulated permease PerM n=1 Tax=Litoreibacter meonggei TaxID=1049199 RepID=A0A497WNX6_9RHOB|nr:AI-2E family transporter [Litoreibacter meonggei]RLJ51649.1 putative PurR-regulated permease PerM [Litoreibacter meonggei]
MQRLSLQTTCLVLLTTISVFTVLHYTKDIFAPVFAALLLGIVLTPLSDFWIRLRIPPALAALISTSLSLMSIMILLLLIEPYITQAINKAPIIWYELRETIDEFKRMLRGLERMSEDVADAIEPTSGEAEKAPAILPSVTDALFYAPKFAAQFMMFTGTLYFFLMAQNSIYAWVGQTFSEFGEEDLRHAGSQVARYVVTISAINLGFGVLVTLAMQLLGMPSPVLWGVLAFTLNFVLYLGPIALVCALLVTGIVVFDGVESFVPAALYLAMNATEAQFVTPTLVGRSLSVNPLLVFLSLVFWLWLWGPIGGIIAIPILIWSMSVFQSAYGQTISSGTPGKLRPSSAAGSAE